MLGVLAARYAGRPGALELTRAELFTLIGRRQETIQQLRLAATSRGELTAITHDTTAQTSTFGEYADPTATVSRVRYACPSVATTHRLVRVHAPQPNPMRAPGEGPGSFALECALDQLAHERGLDPLELRPRNQADRDQHTGLPWSSYAIPVHADMPRFDIALVNEHDPHLAGGVRGIGMIGTVGVAAAIANAVFHATGRRIRDLPIRLEQLIA